ncbi:hypothetical protein CCAX7_38760 [Capsulimonas corticalis]|uniref:Uncharacterized protein n=1 Tax=Capsulimonas corticalis TaxID=2219043 RepID=A0A402D3S3_9BACT|nr:hypothetical protein [Capsulimonas corticalis]BDI31825.1 hypothetical protein CCAX7_38760 [Capsulimonas corticalis]
MTLCGSSSRSFGFLGCCALLALIAPASANAVDTAPSAAASPQTPANAAPDAAPLPAPGAVIPLAPATDLPPPETPEPSAVPIGDRLLIDGDLDLRYRTSTRGRTHSAWANNAEVDLNYPLISHGRSYGAVVVQGMAENPADSSISRGVNLGEAYVVYQIPLGEDSDATAYVKAGRFQIPFALLATYDPHLLLVQPLYSQSLGIRNDVGVQISGRFYGILNYDLSLTSGSSSTSFDTRGKNVVTFRLGRTFYTRNGIVNVGGSMLTGRLPITDIDKDHPFAVDLPPSGRIITDRGVGYINKTRIAGDGTLLYKNVTARGEVVSGADNDQRVLGYFLEGVYKFGGRASSVVERSFWAYPEGKSSAIRTGVGINYNAGAHLTFRTLYEVLNDTPRDQAQIQRQQLTLQALLRF